MKASLFLICLTLAFVLGDSCPSYQCAPSNQTTCVSYLTSDQSNIIYLKENVCTSSQYCDITNKICTSTPTETNRLPGRKCSASSDCRSNKCVTGVCKGLGYGTVCSSSLECDVGLYCTSQVCASLLLSGATCSKNNECTYGFGCLNKTCTPWGSLPIGASIDSDTCENYKSYFCSSGQCYKSEDKAVCIAGAIYSGGDLISCTSDSTCLAVSGSNFLNGKCICGMNPTGTFYCSLFMGSSYGVKYWSAMGKWANSTAAKSCHKAEDPINSLKEYGSNSDYVNYAHNQLWLTKGPSLERMPSCVLNAAFPQNKSFYSSFGYGILVSFGVLIIG